MQLSRSTLGVIVLLSSTCVGASCGGANSNSASGSTTEASKSNGGSQIESLDQVDTSELTDTEKKLWVDLVNDQLSPCGDPISVAKCVASKNKCGACVTAGRYLVRLVTEGYDNQTIATQYQGRFGKSGAAQVPITDAPSTGAPMAKVTIVEFSDFECPHCGAAHPELVELLRKFDGSVRLVYKYFPISGHLRAAPAARAAEAARLQGKFWEMHNLLFEHQRDLEDDDLNRYAQQLGLDMNKFTTDAGSDDTAKRVEAAKQDGVKLGVEATPSFFINGRQFRESPRTLPAYIAEELEL